VSSFSNRYSRLGHDKSQSTSLQEKVAGSSVTTSPVIRANHNRQRGSFDSRKEKTMFWGFILIAALGFMLIRLGMYSVWVGVLSGAFQVALLVIAGLTIALVWRRVFGANKE
jgi:hypothetical protein